MKRFIFLLLALSVLIFFGFKTIRQNVKNDLAQPVALPSVTITPTPINNAKSVRSSDIKRTIFVPYWALDGKILSRIPFAQEDSAEYDEYLYFGISPATSGVNRKEAGFIGLDKFLKAVPKNAERKLVLRMLDSDIIFPILKDQARQKVLIRDTLAIAKENGFSGIVLDLEVSAVPFDSLIKQINEFNKLFYAEARKKEMEFAVMFYGDTFYRIRPFDIKELSENADELMIMSYDFSKSRGNPGPNFPLRGKEVYGYDMTRMTEDFLRFLPPEKTTIVFGFFGYDWEVDDNGKAISQGEPLTYKQIEEKFLGKCKLKDCTVRRKNESTETEVRYKDEDDKSHIVWFEDMESVSAKEKYLKERGIGSFSFWAYSYF